MNVQHYFRAVSDGLLALMAEVGLSPSEIRTRRMSFAVVHADTDFMAELIAGDVIALRSAVEAIGEVCPLRRSIRHPSHAAGIHGNRDHHPADRRRQDR